MPAKKKQHRDLRNMRVTYEEAAEFLGLSKSSFYRLIESGVFTKSEDREYSLGEVTESYWRSILDPNSMTAARTRLFTAQAELNELKLAQERGELVRSGEIIKAWCDNVIKAKTKLLAIPSKLAPELEGQDVLIIKDMLEREIYQALEELGQPDYNNS